MRNVKAKAFALPTVLIASLIMMIVLMAALTSISSIDATVRDQYYTKVANEAAEAGVRMAQACLGNDFLTSWAGKSLAPNTDCNGNIVPGRSAYVIDTPYVRTKFSLPQHSGNNARRRHREHRDTTTVECGGTYAKQHGQYSSRKAD
jgi:Tfp pilus assembly protein PilX